MSAGPEVVLVRHAETEWSRDQRHTGRSDIPLTDRGRAAAAALAPRLAQWSFERVLVSPLVRARETCDLSGLGDHAEAREQLLEWDYGDYEGLTTEQIRESRPGWYLWRDGCPGGERPQDVGARADQLIAEIAGAQGPIAIFSHGHMLRVIGARWISLGPEVGGRLGLSTSAICVLTHEREVPVLGRWNDVGPA